MKSLFSGLILNRRLFLRITGVLSAMLLLLLFPAAALKGAAYGLTLWYRTLFPTLMPFMVLSNFIVYTGCSKSLGILLRPITRLLRLPQSAGYCIITGFLCGYPMGAYVCGSLNEIGELDDDTAAFLAPICNNVSPMFIISYICMNCLGDKSYSGYAVTLLACSAIAGMFLLRFIHILSVKKKGSSDCSIYGHNSTSQIGECGDIVRHEEENTQENFLTSSEAVSRSVEGALMSSLKLCIYVMLFSIAGSMIDGIRFLPETTKAAAMSILEITAGLDRISALDISFKYKIFMMLTFTSFGGISSIFQTMSLWSGKKFNMYKYILYKLAITFITALSVLLSIAAGII